MHQGSLKLERVAAQSMSKAGSLRRRTQGGVYKPVEDHRHCSVCDIGKPYDAMPVVSLSLTTQPLPAGRAQLRRSRLRAAGPVQYQELLEKAQHCTLHSPHGQLEGRAGRRAVLEDGERLLCRAKAMRPEAVQPRLLLMRNLLLQGRGREEEVPREVLRLLHDTHLRQCSANNLADSKLALAAVKLGLDALGMAGKQHRLGDYVTHVTLAIPELKTAVTELLDYSERRVQTRRKSPFLATDSLDDVTG